jgi:trehalose-phosphatase
MTLSGIDDLNNFWKQLRECSRSCLMLDYDGTLAPFRVERDLATPYDGVCSLLQDIITTDHTRLILISGRPAVEVFTLLGGNINVEIWGCHGGERRLPDGSSDSAKISPEITRTLEQAAAWADQQGLSSVLERKPLSTAFHSRGIRNDIKDEITGRFLAGWKQFEGEDITLQQFDGGLELRYLGIDKGTAVRKILKELPAGTVTAYLGDDRTDEDAFTALLGKGLPVLVRSAYRSTKATHWLKPPDELLVFLHLWYSAFKGET